MKLCFYMWKQKQKIVYKNNKMYFDDKNGGDT